MVPPRPLRRLACALALLASGTVQADDAARAALLARLDDAVPATVPALTA
jgi:hypothetical protein